MSGEPCLHRSRVGDGSGHWQCERCGTAGVTAPEGTLAARLAAFREVRDELSRMLDGFPAHGRHTRARWAVEWVGHMIERAASEATDPAPEGDRAALLASVAATRQTLDELADDWPGDQMTRAEAQEFIRNQPVVSPARAAARKATL